MTNQAHEITAHAASVRSTGAAQNGNGHEDDAIQAILLRRQVTELERRVESLTASERKTRTDLLSALGRSQASAKEQAHLHEELTARERTVSEAVSREAQLRAELATVRGSLKKLQANLVAEQAVSAQLPRAETALAAAKADVAKVHSTLADLSTRVGQRSRMLGFLAEQMRQQRRRLVDMRAALDDEGRRREDALRSQIASSAADAGAATELARTRTRTAIEAALAARKTTQRATYKLEAERRQAWFAAASPMRGVPLRRNRPAKLFDKLLCHFGSPGVAMTIARSGLWNGDFQVDNRPSTRRATLIGYTNQRPVPDASVKALFDQRFYLANNPSVASLKRAPLAHYLLYGDRENRNPHPLVDVVYYRGAHPHEMGSTGLTVLQHFLFIGAAQGLNPHPLFDVRYYVGQLSDPQDLAMNPLVHYLRTGWRRGLNPHPLFDNDSYLKRYPDIADMMIPPLLHYVTVGAREGRDPHPIFFGHWYQMAYPDVQTTGANPLEHFLERGLSERRHPNPFFDSDYYLRQASEAYSSGVDPLQHYLQTGALQGLSPNRDFDCLEFLAANMDVLTSNLTPFEAWVEAGRPVAASTVAQDEPAAPTPSPPNTAEYRSVLNLMFDAGFYLEQAGDLLRPGDDPLDHYLATGWRLGLNPHRLFDTAWYVARYPDVLASGLPPLLHFAINGAKDLPDPHPLFDSRWYAETYPDVITGGEIPLVHYLHFGAREGRSPSPLFDTAAYQAAYPDTRGADALLHFLVRWPLDNRPQGFASPINESPTGVDPAEWTAGLADSLARTAEL